MVMIIISLYIAAVCSPGCRNGGSCASPNRCNCPSGWTGGYCQTGMTSIVTIACLTKFFPSEMYIDVNECTAGSHNCDTRNGGCVNTVGSFRCTCNSGYRLVGTSCVGEQPVL